MIDERKFDDARAQVNAQLARVHNDDAGMQCVGLLLLEQGDVDGSIDWLEKSVAASPANAKHHEALGLALRAKTQTAGMLTQMTLGPRLKSELEQAVSLDPSLVDAHVALLTLYAMAPTAMGGDMPKAREHAAAVLKLNPMRGHMAYGQIAEQEKDVSAAEREYRAAVTAQPDSEGAYGAIAAFYRRRERWTDAIVMNERQVQVMANDAPMARRSIAHYALGLSYQGGGHTDRARAEFQAAVSANPSNENAKKALAALP